MPLYEYQCVQCGEREEVIQRLSDPPHSQCSKCGGEMKKLVSAPAIQFKGSGWYKTDYASTKPGAAADSTKSDSKSETKSDTKSETTTATKSETKSEAKSSE
jgi:putative FmdB family regulatory protein